MGVTGAINVNEAAGAGTDSLTIDGSNGSDVFSAGGLATIVNGHEVTYTPYIASITLQGLAGGNTFLVSPSTTAIFNVEGASGTSNNALSVAQPQGQTTTLIDQVGNSGLYVTTGGYQNVSYNNIQTLAAPNTAQPAVTSVTLFYGSGQSLTVQGALPRDLPWQISSIEFSFNTPVYATLNSLSFSGSGAPVLRTLNGSGTANLTWVFNALVSATDMVASLSSSGPTAITAVSNGHALNGNTGTSGANPFSISSWASSTAMWTATAPSPAETAY